jgi:hypothetical protein
MPRCIYPVLCLILGLSWHASTHAQEAQTSSILSTALDGFETYPTGVQSLIERALGLTRLNLKYIYGSADPAKGGMDCSGTMQHLLATHGIPRVPRQANTIYRWAWLESTFHAVNSSRMDSFEWRHLRPGDLLFWSGTYDVDRDPPVTHVMLYLGKLKDGGKPVMFGASEGRRYSGTARNGVSVFDLVLPAPKSSSRFLGYASIPGLKKEAEAPETGKAPSPNPAEPAPIQPEIIPPVEPPTSPPVPPSPPIPEVVTPPVS